MVDRALIVIPARKGSKRIPLKNYTDLQIGKDKVSNLLTRALEVTKRLGFPRIVVVSIDGDVHLKFADLSSVFDDGFRVVHVQRPDELAGDDVPSLDVVKHAIKDIEGDPVFLLQPTAAFIQPRTLDLAMKWMHQNPGLPGIVGVHQYTLKENGALYVVRRRKLLEYGLYPPGLGVLVMDRWESIDVDEWSDFRIAEAIMTDRVKEWLWRRD